MKKKSAMIYSKREFLWSQNGLMSTSHFLYDILVLCFHNLLNILMMNNKKIGDFENNVYDMLSFLCTSQEEISPNGIFRHFSFIA